VSRNIVNSSDQAMGLPLLKGRAWTRRSMSYWAYPSSLHERPIEDLAVAGEVESLLRAASASGAFLTMLTAAA
jgi:hypothetical protein